MGGGDGGEGDVPGEGGEGGVVHSEEHSNFLTLRAEVICVHVCTKYVYSEVSKHMILKDMILKDMILQHNTSPK